LQARRNRESEPHPDPEPRAQPHASSDRAADSGALADSARHTTVETITDPYVIGWPQGVRLGSRPMGGSSS
ncbi:MAG TPA: hypothetical protein VIO16_09130, partial [Dehalococcoidia bacterium]